MPSPASGSITADGLIPTADDTAASIDGRRAPLPCIGLPDHAPSVLDPMAAPGADDLLPQIAGVLTPRGPAWGTDEAGDGSGASPIMRRFWRGIAAFAADVFTRDFALVTQVFPSAATDTLPLWEAELGLPDACLSVLDAAGRVMAVRARFAALPCVAPGDFRCLAARAGYAIRVEEPDQFRCDVSPVCGPDLAESYFRCDEGLCDGADLVQAYFRCDDGACGDTPLEGFILAQPGQGTPLESYRAAAYHDPADAVAGRLPVETFFRCDDGLCDDTPIHAIDCDDPNGTLAKVLVIHLASGGDTLFRCDEGLCGDTPLEGYVASPDLECLIRRETPPQIQVVFDYA